MAQDVAKTAQEISKSEVWVYLGWNLDRFWEDFVANLAFSIFPGGLVNFLGHLFWGVLVLLGAKMASRPPKSAPRINFGPILLDF